MSNNKHRKKISIDTLSDSDLILSDHGEGNPENKIIQTEEKKLLYRAIQKLLNELRQVIVLSYGINDTSKTQSEIAKILNMTQQNVSKLEKKGIAELKKILTGQINCPKQKGNENNEP